MEDNIWKYFLATDLSSNIIKVFKDIFLGIYLLKITDGNIVNVSLFYIVFFLTYVLFIYIVNRNAKTNLVKIFRIGQFLNLLQCVCLLLVEEKIARYTIPFAILSGIANTFYYYPQQILIKRVNKKTNFKKYFTINDISEKIITLVFPVLLGYLISAKSYNLVFLILSIITFISFLLSFNIKLNNVEQPKIDLKLFFNRIKKENKLKAIKAMTVRCALRSLSSFGVIQTLIIILTYLTVASELSLGAITSFITIISILVIYGVNRFIKRENLNKLFIPMSVIQSVVILLLTLGMIFLNLDKDILIFTYSINIGFLLILFYNIINGINNPVFELANKITYYEFMCRQKVTPDDEANYIFYFEIICNLFRSIGYIILIIASFVGFTTNLIATLIILFSLVYIGFAYTLKVIDKKYILCK